MIESGIFDIAKNSKPWNRSQKIDALLSLVALSQLFLSALQGTLIIIGMPEETASGYRVYLSAATIIIAFPFLFLRKPRVVILTYLFAFAIYFFHTVFFPRTIEYWIAEAFRFTLPICIPTVLCVIQVRDRYIFYYYLKLVAYVTGILSLLFGVFTYIGGATLSENYDYSQGFGYMLLFPIIVLFYQKKWYSIAFSAILFLLLIVYGGRGPLLSVVLFFVYVLIKQRRFVLIGVLVGVVAVGIPILASTVKSLGITSRMLELMLTGEMGQSNGRNNINEQIDRGLQQNPYGWGLYGDRVITEGANYAHSFYREILAEFGIYIGSLLLLVFAFEVLKRFKRIKGSDRDMYVLFFFACFVPILFSGSYLTSSNFALFIGIAILLSKIYRSKRVRDYNIK